MIWWVYLIIAIGFQILSGLLQKGSQPKAEEQPKLPSIDGSKSIPVVFGECLITDPFVMDYLDFRHEPIKIRNPATFFITSITIGYRYFLGIVFGLGYATGEWFSSNNPAIKSITIDNREVYLDSLHSSTLFGFTDITLDKQTLFGSKNQEGGIAAKLRYYDGSDPAGYFGYEKVADPYWEDQVMERAGDPTLTMPHYKNVAYAVWHGPSSGIVISGRKSGYIGNSVNLWPIGFKLCRYPIYLFGGTITVGDEPGSTGEHANPIECLYECLINEDYGAGIPEAKIDFFNFRDASFDAWSQGLGFSYLWNTASPVEDMVLEILRHCDAVMYTDLQDGLIKIKMVHQESLFGIKTFTNDDFVKIESFTRGSWEDTKNEVKISFPDHAKVDFEQSTYSYKEVANFAIQGEPKVESITFNGCPSMIQAGRMASREMRGLARPLARLNASIDRKAWTFVPGSIFQFTWPEQGIEDMVMRVTNIKLGTIVDGTITITAIEDVFELGITPVGDVTSTIWTNPVGGNAVDTTAVVGEIPYFVQQDDFNRVFGMAASPSSRHISYDGALDGEADLLEVDFTSYGTLAADLSQLANSDYDTTGFTVESVTDDENVVAGTVSEIQTGTVGLALIGDPADDHEWIAFEGVSGSTDLVLDNVWRGILDTPPREWEAGTQVWFFSTSSAPFVNTLGSTQTVNFEALTRTMENQLSNADATNHNYTIQQRAFRPLPPYYVLYNGDYDLEIWTAGDLEFTWREHSRLSMTAILKQSNADEGGEAGTTYEVDVYGDGDVLGNTYTPITSPWTYSAANQTADFGSPQVLLTFKFYALRDGLRSLYSWDRKIYGFDAAADLVLDGADFVEDGTDLVVA